MADKTMRGTYKLFTTYEILDLITYTKITFNATYVVLYVYLLSSTLYVARNKVLDIGSV